MANPVMTEQEHTERMAKLEAAFPYQFAGHCFGIFVCPGWLPAFEKLCADIDQLLRKAPRAGRLHWTDVKQKYGTLRASYQDRCSWLGFTIPGEGEQMVAVNFDQKERPEIWAAIEDLVERAEIESANQCEWCGAPGALRNSCGGLVTTCDEHQKVRWHPRRIDG